MNNSAINYKITTPSLLSLSVNIFMFMGLACLTLSLFLPVFFTSADDIYGYWVLLIGWLGMIFIQFSWYANPLNLLALLITTKKPITALLLSILALLLASSTTLFYEIPIGLNYEKVFIKEFGIGFYVWYGAQVFFLFALLCRYLIYIKTKRP
ncbi:MAG: hypothetical protein ACI88H_002637 [Cocleimonas sp.]|jgi:hypothetical protein